MNSSTIQGSSTHLDSGKISPSIKTLQTQSISGLNSYQKPQTPTLQPKSQMSIKLEDPESRKSVVELSDIEEGTFTPLKTPRIPKPQNRNRHYFQKEANFRSPPKKPADPAAPPLLLHELKQPPQLLLLPQKPCPTRSKKHRPATSPLNQATKQRKFDNQRKIGGKQ
jgi:hypothetical protein